MPHHNYYKHSFDIYCDPYIKGRQKKRVMATVTVTTALIINVPFLDISHVTVTIPSALCTSFNVQNKPQSEY